MRIVSPLLSAFLSYIDWRLSQQFHAIRILKTGRAPRVPIGRPLVVYLNHASWWDPLMMMWLGWRCYPGRPQYGPIEAAQLERYAFFKYLGVFGVEKGTLSGARRFLRVSEELLALEGAMLWLTPQGRFADVRERPLAFASGLAHLAMRRREALFVPLAIEYRFGQEQLPEIVLNFGAPLEGEQLAQDVHQVRLQLEGALSDAMDEIAGAASFGRTDVFETMLQGSGGASLAYDMWRRMKALLRRERPRLNHADVL